MYRAKFRRKPNQKVLGSLIALEYASEQRPSWLPSSRARLAASLSMTIPAEIILAAPQDDQAGWLVALLLKSLTKRGSVGQGRQAREQRSTRGARRTPRTTGTRAVEQRRNNRLCFFLRR
jgi:hypothetical protein